MGKGEAQSSSEIIPMGGLGPTREVRRVPRAWEHPTDENGRPRQLSTRESLDGFEQYLEPGEELTPEYIAENFMPDFTGVPDEEMGLMIYHRDGQPKGPIFPDDEYGRERLLAYASEYVTTWGSHYGDVETWYHMLFDSEEFAGIDLRNGSAVRIMRAAMRWRIEFALAKGPHSPSEATKERNHT